MSHAKTLVHQIAHWATKRPAQAALHAKRDGRWTALTWKEYWASVRDIAKGLIALGHQAGDCVALVGANHPEWVQLQFGIQAAAGVPAPLYVTNTAEQNAYIVKHCSIKLVCADTATQVAKFHESEAAGAFPELKKIVGFFDDLTGDRVMGFQALRDLGREQDDAELDKRLASLNETDTCMLIFTSGTTGVPKGVELDSKGQYLIGNAVNTMCPQLLEAGAYHVVSYLPLCHQAEQLLTNVASLITGGEVYFCPEISELKDYLVDARPTVFLGVPRVWEKFEAALSGRFAEASGLKAKLVSWSRKAELSSFQEQVRRGDLDYMPLQRKLARKLVMDKVRGALGLDRLLVALTGSAPMAAKTQDFFASLGICIYEAYGLSETCGVVTITDPHRPRFGTVGKPVAGVEVRISDDGEIQAKGANNTRSYFGMPEKTAELFTEDGWLKTGDLGSFTDDGNLQITGRIKELIITAGGKNIAPVELENYAKGIFGVGQCVVIGDRKPFLSALLALDPETLSEFCGRVGVPVTSMEELSQSEKVLAWLQKEIDEKCNAKVARVQQIKKVVLLPQELSVENGELTATMKLRRSKIVERHQVHIEALYASTKSESKARA